MKKIYIEYFWAYDWVLCWKYENEDILYHRIDNSEVLEKFQLEDYWPIYFKTKKWFFKNIFRISEKEFLFYKKKKFNK